MIVEQIPVTWGRDDARVQDITARHCVDAPLAQLAVVLAPCALFAEDPDLIDTVGATKEWLDVTHALANEGAYEDGVVMTTMTGGLAAALVKGSVRGVRQLPTMAQIGLLAAGGLVFARATRRGNITAASNRLKSLTGSVFELYWPGFEKFTGWVQTGSSSREQHELAPLTDPALDERVARALAVSPHPMTAPKIAEALGDAGSLTDRTAEVRSVLALYPLTFVEISRWRYQLGSGPTASAALADGEVAKYRANRRRHLSFPAHPANRHRNGAEVAADPAAPPNRGIQSFPPGEWS